MARPSVKAERTEEILDAFERCVARFGVEGTSLERIAEESGLRRSLLRYYIGNRDELVEALTDRFVAKAESLTQEMINDLPEEGRSIAMVDAFFEPSRTDDSTILVADALISCSAIYPEVKKKLKGWYDNFVQKACDIIQADYPSVSSDRCFMVAVAIIGIYFNADAMDTLELSGRYREAAIESAKLLLSTLED
ncbi:hypothetical protein R50073_28790 [Maricurvus nonylphenolicus]|uniref:TetR/AcrR family transcriptional regulator n=1 Tax=Maricurvus nonylphenolicus TaxID=1008307 RepID=UPI0036F2F018